MSEQCRCREISKDLTRMECKVTHLLSGEGILPRIDLTRMECKAVNAHDNFRHITGIDLTRMECKDNLGLEFIDKKLKYRFNQNGM